jgi:hypothetical protein
MPTICQKQTARARVGAGERVSKRRAVPGPERRSEISGDKTGRQAPSLQRCPPPAPSSMRSPGRGTLPAGRRVRPSTGDRRAAPQRQTGKQDPEKNTNRCRALKKGLQRRAFEQNQCNPTFREIFNIHGHSGYSERARSELCYEIESTDLKQGGFNPMGRTSPHCQQAPRCQKTTLSHSIQVISTTVVLL